MKLDRLTDAARAAVERAFSRAAELRHLAVEPEHLLLAMVTETGGTAAEQLKSLGVPADNIVVRLDEMMERRQNSDHEAPE